MAAHRARDGIGLHVLQLYKGAGKEREPNVDRYQTEGVVKRQEGQKLQAVFIMALDQVTLSDNAVTALDLMIHFFG